jgi:Icc-related predicted phosphoesterase
MSRISKKTDETYTLNSTNFFMNSYIPGNKILSDEKDNFQQSSLSIKKLMELNSDLVQKTTRENEWQNLKQEISLSSANKVNQMNQKMTEIDSQVGYFSSETDKETYKNKKKAIIDSNIKNMENFYIEKFRSIKPIIDTQKDKLLQTRIKKNNTQIIPYFDRNIRRSKFNQSEPPLDSNTKTVEEIVNLSSVNILEEKSQKIAGKVEWLATVIFGSVMQIGQNYVMQGVITSVVTATGLPVAGGFLVGASVLMIAGMGKEYWKRKGDPTTLQDELEFKSLISSGLSYVALNSLTLLSPAAIGPEYGITMETLFGSNLTNIIPFTANGFLYNYTEGVIRNVVPMGINIVLFGSSTNGRQQKIMLAETAFNDPEEAKLAIDWALLFKKNQEIKFDSQFFLKRYLHITDSTIGIIAKFPFKFGAQIFEQVITPARWISDTNKKSNKTVGMISWLAGKTAQISATFLKTILKLVLGVPYLVMSTFCYVVNWVFRNTVDRLGIGNITRVITVIFLTGFIVSLCDSTVADGEAREIFNTLVRKSLQYFSELFTSEHFYTSIISTNLVIPMVNPAINNLLKNNLDSVVSFLVISLGLSYAPISTIYGNLNIGDLASASNMDNFTKLTLMSLSLLGGWGFIKLVKKYMGSDLPEHVQQIYNMPEGPEKQQALNNLALSSRQHRLNKFSNNPSIKEKIKRIIENTTIKVLDKINFYDFMTSYELRYGDTLIMRQNSETLAQFLLVDCFMQQQVARITENFTKAGVNNIKSLSSNAYNWYFDTNASHSITKAQFINQEKQIAKEETAIEQLIDKAKKQKEYLEDKLKLESTIPDSQNKSDYVNVESMKKFNRLKKDLDKVIGNLQSYDNQLIGLNEYKQLLEVSKQYTQQINKNGFGVGTAFLMLQDGKIITPTSSQDMPDEIIIPNFPRGGGMVSFFTSTFIQTQSWWKNPDSEQKKLEIATSFTQVLERIRQNDPTISQSHNILDNASSTLDSLNSYADNLHEDESSRLERIARKNKAVDSYVLKEKQKYISANSNLLYQAKVSSQQLDDWKKQGEKLISSEIIYQEPGEAFNTEKIKAQTEISDSKARLQLLKQQYKSLDMDLASIAMQNYIAKDSDFDYKDKIRFGEVLEGTYKYYNDFNKIEDDLLKLQDRYIDISVKAADSLNKNYEQMIIELQKNIAQNPGASQVWIKEKQDEITTLIQKLNDSSQIISQGRVHYFNKDPLAFLLQHSIETVVPGINFIQTSLERGTNAINDFFNQYTSTRLALKTVNTISSPFVWTYRYLGIKSTLWWQGEEMGYQKLKTLTMSGLKRSQMLALMASRANMVQRGKISDVVSKYSNNIKEFLEDSPQKENIIQKIESFEDLLTSSLRASQNHQEIFTETLKDITISSISQLNDPDFEEQLIQMGGSLSEVAQKVATDIMTDISTQIDLMTDIDLDILTDFAYAFDRPDIDLSSLSTLSPSNNVQVPSEPPLNPSDSQEFRKFTTSSLGVNIEESLLENITLNQSGKKSTKLNALIPKKVQDIWKKRALELGDGRMYKRNMLWMAYDDKASSQLETQEVDLNMLLTMTRTTQFLRNMDIKSATQHRVDTKASDEWFKNNANNPYVKNQYSEKRKDELAKDSSTTWSGTEANNLNIVSSLEDKGIGWLDAIRISDQGLLRIVNYGKDEDEKITDINEFYRIMDSPGVEKPKIYWNNPHVLDLFSDERPGMNAGDVSNKANWIQNNQNLSDDKIISDNFRQVMDAFEENKQDLKIPNNDQVRILLDRLSVNLNTALSPEAIETETVEKGRVESTVEWLFGSQSYISNSHIINFMKETKDMSENLRKQYRDKYSQGKVVEDEKVENQPVMINRGPNDEIVLTKLKSTVTNSDVDGYANTVIRSNIYTAGGIGMGLLSSIGIRGGEALYNSYVANGEIGYSQLTNMRNLCNSLDTHCPPAEASVGEIRDVVFEGSTKVSDEARALTRETLNTQIEELKIASISHPSPNPKLQDLAGKVINSYDLIHQTSKTKVIRNTLYSSLGNGRTLDRGYVQKDDDLFFNFLSWRTYQNDVNRIAMGLNDHYKDMYQDNKILIDSMKDAELV